MAVGVAALFLEVHPDRENALCDGPNIVPLLRLEALLSQLLSNHHAMADGIAVSTV
jgi:2-dehydro-3-deoxyphosphooctonate aldolase (KDO 8-P synthase)